MSLNSERTLPFSVSHCPSVSVYKKINVFVFVHFVNLLFLSVFILSPASPTRTLYVFLIPKMVHISLFSIWHIRVLLYVTKNVQRMSAALLEHLNT